MGWKVHAYHWDDNICMATECALILGYPPDISEQVEWTNATSVENTLDTEDLSLL